MLIFGDESGDAAIGNITGVSRYLAFALVLFEGEEEAAQCLNRIDRLRNKLHLPPTFEFHFRNNSAHIRREFLKAVRECSFAFVVNVHEKPADNSRGTRIGSENLYCGTLLNTFSLLAPYVTRHCRITMDEYGSEYFQRALKKRVVAFLDKADTGLVKKYSAKRSRQNNLLQLADYVASICNRRASGKPDAEEYWRLIADKELL